MIIKINPNLNNSQKISFSKEKKDLAEGYTVPAPRIMSEQTPEIQPEQYQPYSKTQPKGFVSKVSYGWINLTQGVSGLLKGVIYGFLAGTTIAGADYLIAGSKKLAKGSLKGEGAFKPKNVMSKKGKILSYVAAGVVLLSNLIIAKLKANRKTANVDHMLYDGHRG